MFRCNICNRIFFDENLLKIHKLEAHQEGVKTIDSVVIQRSESNKTEIPRKKMKLRNSSLISVKFSKKSTEDSDKSDESNNLYNPEFFSLVGSPSAPEALPGTSYHEFSDQNSTSNQNSYTFENCLESIHKNPNLIFKTTSKNSPDLESKSFQQNRPNFLKISKISSKSSNIGENSFDHLFDIKKEVDQDHDKKVAELLYPTQSLKCKICDFKTTTEKSLTTHVRVAHSQTQNEFLEDEIDSTEKEIQASRTLKSGKGNNLNCSICMSSFNSLKEMNAHLQSDHNIKPSTVSYSFEHSRAVTEVIVKLKVQTTQKNRKQNPLKCEKCVCTFYRVSNLARHRRNVHSEMLPGYYFCELCKFFGKNKNSIDRHIKSVHLGIKKMDKLCTQCADTFETVGELNFHRFLHSEFVEKVDNDEEQLMPCSLCLFDSPNSIDVLEHLESLRIQQ